MRGGNVQDAAAKADRFAAAYRDVRGDASIQYTLGPATPPAPPPAWMQALSRWLADLFRPVARFLRWIGSLMPDAPYARILLWGVIALAAAMLAWMVYDRVRHGVWRLPRRRRAGVAASDGAEEAWQPDAAPVRAWLREADALAADGRYAEAIHLLLLRSVDDMQRRRPAAVRPALTSRELAASSAVPVPARGLFARIAGAVEASLFGGHPVDAAGWAEARAAYADYALPTVWKR